MSAKDISPRKPCCFCNLAEDNEVEYGKIYEYNGIVTHYYCLLLSSNMEQKGTDDEGILGFLTEDIQKELRRGKRLTCSYCKKTGATLGCCNVRCKRIFHFPCGLKKGSLHQFFGEFRSFCENHRPKQKIDDHVLKQDNSLDNVLCYVCYDKVNPIDPKSTLWAPCCKKDAWFHRKCIQQLALSAGYFFKCPLCNNKKIFQEAMLEYGIFVPSQDASWELVPNAFEELLYRHDQCDAIKCLCPKGRKHTSSNAKWELALCRTCGSQGIHMACGQLKWANPMWECVECTSILNAKENAEAGSDSSSDGSSQRDSDTDSDSDTDISVGTDFPTLCLSPSLSPNSSFTSPYTIPALKLRPGPRSFKLQQIKADSMLKRTSELTQNDLNENITAEIKSEGEIKNLSPEEELLTNKKDISQQGSEENNSEEERQWCSNNEKSEPIRKGTDIITIESDDDNNDNDIQVIALRRNANIKSTSQSILTPSISTYSNANTSPLNSIEISATSKSSSATSIDLMKDSIDLQKSIVSKSKINVPTTSGKFNVMTLKGLPRPIVWNSDDLEEMNMSDTSRDSVMNIKITNVTSLPPEVFESVPDVACENVTLYKDPINISSTKTLEKFVTHVSPKRSIYEEASSVADNCKKIKGSDFNSYDIVMHDTSEQQSEMMSSYRLNDICDSNQNPSKCTSVKEISDLNNSQKNDISTQFTFHKLSDVSQVGSNYPRENHVFSIRNNEVITSNLNMPIVESGNLAYIPLSKRSCFGKIRDMNTTSNQNAGNGRNAFSVTTSGDVLSHASTLASNYRQSVLVRHTTPTNVTTSVIVNGTEELNKQKVTLVNENVLNPADNPLGNVCCDGDAGSSPETGRRGEILSGDSPGSVDNDVIDSPSATRSVFPQVTNNHTTCHRPRLIPQYMNLRDLKFRVYGKDNVQMILYDTFSVTIPTSSKERKIRLTSVTSREPKESSSFASRGEPSSSSDHDSAIAEQHFDKFSHSLKNESYLLINDKTGHVTHIHDDVKENLDPISRVSQRTDTITSLTNNVDDTVNVRDYIHGENDDETHLVSSDTNLSKLNYAMCSTNVDNVVMDGAALISNDRDQDSRFDPEDAQRYKQEKTDSVRTFCKETNRTVHGADVDFNVLNKTNKSVRKILRNDTAVFTSQYIDNREIGNDGIENSPILWNGHKHLDNTNVMRPRLQNWNVSNITFNERNILNKQIDACDSGKFIRCMTFQENTVNRNSENSSGYNGESSFKVSIDLRKIQNLIDSKPELFVNQEHNADDRRHESVNHLHGRQQVRYRDIDSNVIKRYPPKSKSKELQVSNCTNSIEQTQIRDTPSGANTFAQYKKPKREIRYFDKRILGK